MEWQSLRLHQRWVQSWQAGRTRLVGGAELDLLQIFEPEKVFYRKAGCAVSHWPACFGPGGNGYKGPLGWVFSQYSLFKHMQHPDRRVMHLCIYPIRVPICEWCPHIVARHAAPWKCSLFECQRNSHRWAPGRRAKKSGVATGCAYSHCALGFESVLQAQKCARLRWRRARYTDRAWG